MSRWIVPGLLLALSGCGMAGDGRYVGTLTAEQGTCGIGFDEEGHAPATLLLQGHAAQFAPTSGVEVLAGHVNATGHIVASATAPGADHKPFLQVFEGDRDAAGKVVGAFATPRCRAKVTLARPG